MGLGFDEYLVGAAFFGLIAGGSLFTAAVIQRRLLAGLPPAIAVLSFGLVASAAVSLACFVPGATGILSRWTVAGTSVALALAAWRLIPRRQPHPEPPTGPTPRSPRWSWGLAAAGAAAASMGAVAYLHARSLFPVTGIDALSFHLPTVARWIQLGTFWAPIDFQPNLSTGTYPHTGNLTALAAIIPWRNTWAARYVDLPFLGMAAVATYALAREIRAPAAPALLAAAALTSMAAMNRPALANAQVDPQMIAWFTAGIVFLIRFHRLGNNRDLVLAGLGLGLAFGTKWYSLPYVPAVILVWLVAAHLGGRPWRELLRPALVLGTLILGTGSFWLIRNWVEYGNPLHPTPVEVFGVTIFDAPPDPVREQAGWSIAHYFFDGSIWSDFFFPAFRDTLGLVALAALVGIVAAAVVAVIARRRDRMEASIALAIAAGSALIAVIYVNIPYTAFGAEGQPILTVANTRYLVPALVGGLALTAWLAGRAGRWRPAVEGALVIALLDSARRAYEPAIGSTDVVRSLVALTLAAFLARIAWRNRGVLTGPRTAAAVLAIVVVAATAAGWWLERRQATNPYGRQDAAIQWLEAHATNDSRVGLAGRWRPHTGFPPILPAFGRELRNEVSFLGEHVDGTMRRYRHRATFVAALRRREYDLLLVGTDGGNTSGGRPAELGWARAEGFEPMARSQRFVLLRRNGAGVGGSSG